tara:strand:- start:414 stop:593 length:180 start_codon:yes stop_codon:yes gene_type:complete
MEEKDEDVIAISQEEVKLNLGGTKITISGILSKRHAQILIALTLAMVGLNYETIMGMVW